VRGSIITSIIGKLVDPISREVFGALGLSFNMERLALTGREAGFDLSANSHFYYFVLNQKG
jgi:hypothetical protein